MESLSYKTISANAATVTKEWVLIDATDAVVGRLASQVAKILRGKNKPTYTPHVDTGDNVIVINAAQVKLTGKKASQKKYYRHSNYPGGLKTRTAGDFLAKEPEKLLETAIKGMLPHNSLGHKMGLKLHVYAGEDHKHAAQKPEALDITNLI